jgi:hypothetical protein
MNRAWQFGALALPFSLMLAALAPAAKAQVPVPVVAPVAADVAAPIVAKAVKPRQKSGVAKFEGFVMNANRAQITVRAKGNDLAIQTFALSGPAADKMQQIIDKGGYQYGDKVTIFYDPANQQVVKIKGKPSRPI